MKHENYDISSRIITIMQTISNTDDDILAKASDCKDAKAFANKRLRSGFSIEQLFKMSKCCGFEFDIIFKYNNIQIPLSNLISSKED